MKKKNLGKWLVVLVALVAVSTSMIAGTFAKYTSEFAGSDTALVAKWDVTVTGGQTGSLTALSDGSPAAALDLFSHKYNTNILASAGTNKIIAPGVKGEFVLKVKNSSDVAAKVEFALAKDPASVDIPLTFAIGSTAYADFAALQTALNTEFATLAVGSAEKSVTVSWEWPFYADAAGDTADTALGQASALGTGSGADGRTGYTLNVTATATQLAPSVTP